ncbi:hypothetical protein ZYGR_0U00430 [Zygosaccharomyces rouxii]|uniref:ZYRO0F09680p n=2 Tax=Zygosaccharomyces rouxii TaxID=4956 RepID=C5DY24_ZYGRC|nr:uncharacterized protein ZYRO0F09680g [Zygosaccharomyces rouxii]KAH9199443.1 hypothetical protein LQ764DRAFT_214021 [Zygosaccharomyces rouxii]GAV50187.1 hypothetical protein ZYGR_0U00430 [Zygosaccharomyces rouxii]CAR28685.1 ZYRO0F09680p [Zygosaccharomyces rouxii]
MGMSEVAQWFLTNTDICLHQSVKIDKSTIGDPASGYGVFVDLSKTGVMNGDKNTLELMRIPHGVTFDVHTVFQVLNDGTWYSSRQEFEKTKQKFKDVFARMLEYEGMMELLNESNTLVGFFLVCAMLRDEYELPSVLVYYLDNVLLETTIENAAKHLDLLMEYYEQYVESHLFSKMLRKFEQFADRIPRETVRQVFAAVKSRCLEIPQELDQDSDDFVVNSTLVPLLDLCNHSNRPNSHFDVDRETGDVILLLDLGKSKPLKDKFQEVFISYTPLVEMLSFHNNYGFVPPPDDFQFFNLSIERDFLSQQKVGNRDLRLFCKWFKINPVVQLIRYKGKWYINDTLEAFALLLLPFLPLPDDFTKSCWHYDDRNYETFAHFHQFLNDNDFTDFTQSLKFYKREIRQQEHQNCDTIWFPQLAWCFRYKDDGELLRRRVEQIDALELAPFEDRKQFELVIERFKEFFVGYLDHRESTLRSYQGDNESFNQLLHLELDILQQLNNGLKQNQVQFWSDIDTDAQEVPQLPFVWKPSGQEIQNDENLELDWEMLSIKPYNPRELTDFYDEELHSFLQVMQG